MARDSLVGRVFDVSLADLNKNSESQAFRVIRLIVDHVEGNRCYTNFYGMRFTTDKLKSLIRKWQTLIEGSVDVKTTDGYTVRLFCIAFTKRRQNQVKKTSYAQSSQVKQIRAKMIEIMQRESNNCDLKQLFERLIVDIIGQQIEKECQGIYPLQNVFIRKAKIVRRPKVDVHKIMELHSESVSTATVREDVGQPVEQSS